MVNIKHFGFIESISHIIDHVLGEAWLWSGQSGFECLGFFLAQDLGEVT